MRIEGAAALVWEALDAPRAIDDVVAAVSAGTADDLAEDVARTLQFLAAAGLVECT